MKRFIVAGVAALTLAGGAFAFADSLTVNTTQLGSGGTGVTSCQGPTTPVNVSYTTAYDATLKTFKVTNVAVANIAAACDVASGPKLTVEITGAANASLGEGFHNMLATDGSTVSFTVGTGASDGNINAASITANAVQDVHVLINGGPVSSGNTTLP